MDEKGAQEERRNRRLLYVFGFVLVWELLGRPFLAHLCPTHELPPSLIREILNLGIFSGMGI